ncbi:uncharacterized protein LOC119741921 [Patiria miniata]|uniref:EF-hand domain-containing protein n=1 Tax=Patiria miniata TaxID=46514 RepID=A0A914BCR9_PATMI|nr:uncharacterized protein LOC119741921 [Patiria miniata]
MIKFLENTWYSAKRLADGYTKDVKRETQKYQTLRDLDLFVLDNSIRESTVGQLRGHTLEDKWKVYDEVKRCGFTNVIVASFSHMTRVDDVFVKQLVEKGEDRKGLYAFSEITEGAKNRIPNTEKIPVGLQKMKETGLWNAILEVDLSDGVYDFSKFTMDDMCALVKKWIMWVYDNLHRDAKVLINLRDMSDVMPVKPARVFQLVKFLAEMPEDVRPFALLFEEARGLCVPEECGNWAKYIRKTMDMNEWKGKLLVHIHEKYGYADSSQLESLMCGADGTWGSICIEGAAMGNASTCVTMMNLIRLGNKKILKSYNCSYLRKAAINVTRITTDRDPHLKQPVYGERALDFVLGLNKEDFDLADFFGEKAPKRITSLASNEMIRLQLIELYGNDPQFTLDQAHKMKEAMLEDLRNNRKEEYMSEVGLALLFDRAGGKVTEKMRDIIEKMKLNNVHAERMLSEVREIWDTWDLKDEVQGDEMLEYDSFYNGFMAPYFACYRCSDTHQALQAIDMDADGQVDWSEFLVYLKWALHEYPNIKDTQELLDIAFRKGLIPAMRDELLKD